MECKTCMHCEDCGRRKQSAVDNGGNATIRGCTDWADGEYRHSVCPREYLPKQQASACELLAALIAATSSLQTIAERAGKDEYLEDMMQVRGYANSRYMAANAVLEGLKKQMEDRRNDKI